MFTDISKNINKLRYSTLIVKNDETLDDLLNRSQEIFAKPPPFDLSLGKTHVELAQAFSRAPLRRSLNPNIVYIYKDNELVEGSPFFLNSVMYTER